MSDIIISGLNQNNLKHISINIKKNKLTVFTGVSGSGKSSIVFDTIAAESQRQLNETYPAFVKMRLPKYQRPNVEYIDHLTASIIIDQKSLGGNIRSTVGTITELYTDLRLLFSRFGQPCVGTASCFSFNDVNGMCKNCSGLGKVTTINMDAVIDHEKSWNSGCVNDTAFKPGSWYWRQYAESGLFDLDKPIREYSVEEYNLLLYGSQDGNSASETPKVPGLFHKYSQTFLNRDISKLSTGMRAKAKIYIKEKDCDICHGMKLNQAALNCRISGYSIADMANMELTDLYPLLLQITDKRIEPLVKALTDGIKRIIDIGLPYLHLNRDALSLSGGEAQRLKLVRSMGSSLTGMTYIFDEPSTGMHARDVHRMNKLLLALRDKGNTVLVVEHDKDIIAIADEIIDVGPLAGKAGGEIVFQGSYHALTKAHTLTGQGLRMTTPLKEQPRTATGFLPIRNAQMHNLKGINVDIPLGIMTVITGAAGSGKSTLISRVFAKQYEQQVIIVNQDPITAVNRSTPSTFLGFFDDIRRQFAEANGVDAGMFSFNSKGACPCCQGKGVIVTELAFMDPTVTECEACQGRRYSVQARSFRYRNKTIVDILDMTVTEALDFFNQKKIQQYLNAMKQVGLSYMSIGQPLSTLSGGERQRMKLAKYLDKKSNIYILDEPTTGLHMADVNNLIKLLNKITERGNTVIIIEHNLDVIKQSDWIIDIGPDGGKHGGELMFQGTPEAMVKVCHSITADCLKNHIKESPKSAF